MTALLLENKDLEALEVSELTSSLSLSDLLGPRRLGPLLLNGSRLPELGDGGRASGTRNLGDDNLSEGDVSKRDSLTGDTRLRTVNEDLLLVFCSQGSLN